MTLPELQAIADRINTGTNDPDTSRALVVFNLTSHPVSGIAEFRASMSWSLHQPLPPVAVTEPDGTAVPAAVLEMQSGPDGKGRSERRQLSFALHFAVSDVPAQGWRTYIASYADASSPLLENGSEPVDLNVVETIRHSGDFSSMGKFSEVDG